MGQNQSETFSEQHGPLGPPANLRVLVKYGNAVEDFLLPLNLDSDGDNKRASIGYFSIVMATALAARISDVTLVAGIERADGERKVFSDISEYTRAQHKLFLDNAFKSMARLSAGLKPTTHKITFQFDVFFATTAGNVYTYIESPDIVDYLYDKFEQSNALPHSSIHY